MLRIDGSFLIKLCSGKILAVFSNLVDAIKHDETNDSSDPPDVASIRLQIQNKAATKIQSLVRRKLA